MESKRVDGLEYSMSGGEYVLRPLHDEVLYILEYPGSSKKVGHTFD